MNQAAVTYFLARVKTAAVRSTPEDYARSAAAGALVFGVPYAAGMGLAHAYLKRKFEKYPHMQKTFEFLRPTSKKVMTLLGAGAALGMMGRGLIDIAGHTMGKEKTAAKLDPRQKRQLERAKKIGYLTGLIGGVGLTGAHLWRKRRELDFIARLFSHMYLTKRVPKIIREELEALKKSAAEKRKKGGRISEFEALAPAHSILKGLGGGYVLTKGLVAGGLTIREILRNRAFLKALREELRRRLEGRTIIEPGRTIIEPKFRVLPPGLLGYEKT